ncbi:hypothetical protein [Mycobacterium sp. EPa45]|nr:hypothetical protein [Mycobacterium sp. EPa45]
MATTIAKPATGRAYDLIDYLKPIRSKSLLHRLLLRYKAFHRIASN